MIQVVIGNSCRGDVMIFDKTLHVIEESHISDGMGGNTTVKEITDTFKAIVIDLPIDTSLNSNIIIKAGTRKVITKRRLSQSAFSFVDEDNMELRVNRFQRVKNHYVYLVEEVGLFNG